MSSLPQERSLGEFSRKVVVALVLTLAALGLVALLWFAIHLLLLIFAGIVLAVLLSTLADWLQRQSHFPHWLCYTLVCLVILAALGGLVWLIAAQLAGQADVLVVQLEQALKRLESYLADHPWGHAALQRLRHGVQGITTGEVVARSTTAASNVVKFFVDTFVVFFVGLLAGYYPQLYLRGFLHLIPIPKRRRVELALRHVASTLWWWLVGQFMAMAAVGILTWIGLWILGVPLVSTLAILAAFLNFIPNFGPLLAAVPATLLGLLVSPLCALWVIVLYTSVQMVQNHVISPVIHSRIVALPPVVLVVAQVLMGMWAGALGVVLSSALAVTVMVLLQMLYVQDLLGDPMELST